MQSVCFTSWLCFAARRAVCEGGKDCRLGFDIVVVEWIDVEHMSVDST